MSSISRRARQCLINAEIGKLGFSTNLIGKPTYQELRVGRLRSGMILRHTCALRHDDGRHFDYGVRPLWLHPSRTRLDLGMGSMVEIAFKPGLSRMENSFGLRRADTRFRHWSGCRVSGGGCGRHA